MVVTVAISGIATGILGAALALLSGLSFLGAILAYCMTGSLFAVLMVAALALRPAEADADAEAAGITQTV
jgi:hypothetical protein